MISGPAAYVVTFMWQLEAVDKRGKLFDKLDTSSSGHVTVEAFQAFFGKMKTERGEQVAPPPPCPEGIWLGA